MNGNSDLVKPRPVGDSHRPWFYPAYQNQVVAYHSTLFPSAYGQARSTAKPKPDWPSCGYAFPVLPANPLASATLFVGIKHDLIPPRWIQTLPRMYLAI